MVRSFDTSWCALKNVGIGFYEWVDFSNFEELMTSQINFYDTKIIPKNLFASSIFHTRFLAFHSFINPQE
jgi:hypothetical protein